MQRLQLKSILYREETKYALYFVRNPEIQAILKDNFPQIRWSNSQKAWILPFETKIKSQLFQVLRGKIWIDYSSLKTKEETAQIAKPHQLLADLNDLHKDALLKFKNYLSANRYSENTIKTYADALATFLRFYAQKPLSEISNLDVETF
ncbi:MAG: phage integrase N-terminal SAM-like domain-containing protein, partial [Flavobacteriia bacterium]